MGEVSRSGFRRRLAVLVVVACVLLGLSGVAVAAVSPSDDADALAAALDHTEGAVSGAKLVELPPKGDPTGTFDSELAVFPLAGEDATILSTGAAAAADSPNDAPDTSTVNTPRKGGGGPEVGTSNDDTGGGSPGVPSGNGFAINDLVKLRVKLDVPADRNCLTFEFRFLTEEFPEFIGSDFNDAFIAELDETSFTVDPEGRAKAPANFAFDPDGRIVTVAAAGTSADNALGTTYDGATPILRASTPITPGVHRLFFSIYDASDSIYDSAVLLDNLRLRSADPANCTRGSATNPNADDTCLGEAPTVFASDGVATGTRGDDVIQGSDAGDRIKGKGGDDLICGGPGGDEILGGGGDDRIQGNSGSDALRGGAGRDRIDGKRGADGVDGGAGPDRLKGSGKDDLIEGGRGGDFIAGGRGGDRLEGNGGKDRLNGESGADRLDGGGGNDRCDGGAGRDRLRRC